MATFIKAGFWEKLCKPCKGYKGWLNLDELIQSLAPPAPEPTYKVYTALLTQSGGDNALEVYPEDGPLTIGVTYTINGYAEGDDFTNVGAPSNTNGLSFVATGTTPTHWAEGTGLLYNTGAPVATVLENTIGNIWFTYNVVGGYVIYSDSQFIQNKTFALIAFPGASNTGGSAAVYVNQVPQYLSMETRDYAGTSSDSILYDTSIEIRIYN